MQEKEKNQATLRILVVEDQRIYYEWLKFMYLEPIFTWVDNGQKAVDKILSMHYFDAIIMNIKMPVMDGLTATQEIRGLYYPRPIIGWSAHTKEIAEESCLYAGMDVFIQRCGQDLGIQKIITYLESQ